MVQGVRSESVVGFVVGKVWSCKFCRAKVLWVKPRVPYAATTYVQAKHMRVPTPAKNTPRIARRALTTFSALGTAPSRAMCIDLSTREIPG